MTDREIFPANTANRSITVSIVHRGSLVARGLAAIQNGTKLAQIKDNDTLYRQARDVYDLITDCPEASWWYARIGREWMPISALTEAFITFQRLAAEGYGKAYYPLSMLYGGKHSLNSDTSLAQHFAKQAVDWCLANSIQDDPEIWNDLGCLYMDSIRDSDQAIKWFRKAAEHGYAKGALNLSTMLLCGPEEYWEESEYWQIKGAELGNLCAIFGQIRYHEFNGPDHEPDDEQALYWYRKAAEQGYPWTEADFGAERFFDLGMRYRHGYGDSEADEDKAEEYFLEAANLGNAEAQYELAWLLYQRSENTDFEYWLKRSADLGFGPAQLAYVEWLFIPEDEAQVLIDAAHDWYKTQAESGDEVWQYEYSMLLLRDDNEWCGDPHEGLRWLTASARQNYPPACRRLGLEYLREFVSGYTQGVYWLSRAAELGDTLACESLGDLYLLGHGGGLYAERNGRKPPQLIPPDPKMAVTWYERGIATGTPFGNRPIAYTLGENYLTGEHLDQDLQLAEKWLLHSAEHGYSSAQQLLGEEYLSGIRLHMDVDAAIHWLELAGESSIAVRLKLAALYLDGKIVPQNLDLAIDWLTRDPDGTGHMNRQMKLVAEKCFDGRFGKDEESIAYQWLEQMAGRVIEKANTVDHRYAARPYYYLAEIYELGLGVDRDMETAIYWYRRSAGEGFPLAKTHLQKLGIDWKSP